MFQFFKELFCKDEIEENEKQFPFLKKSSWKRTLHDIEHFRSSERSRSKIEFKSIPDEEIIGFDSVIFYENSTVNRKNEKYPECINTLYLDVAPAVGSTVLITIKSPLYTSTNKAFWVYFKPELSSVNGELYKEDIANLAILECEEIRSIILDRIDTLVLVKIKDSILLKDIPKRLKSKKVDPNFQISKYERRDINSFQHEKWFYYEESSQGYTGYWFLLLNENEEYRIIIESEWFGHDSCFKASNQLISKKLFDTIPIKRIL